MTDKQHFIPVAEPAFGDKELEYVIDCVKSGWISSLGRYVRDFEQQFAAYCGVRYGVATFNGTVALHLLAATLNLGPGDEVIMPSLTFVATANAIRYTGATPVFVDSERETWNLDPNTVVEAITPRTKAIVAVHLYGHPADMDPLAAIAAEHGLLLLEDAAEAHGALYKGRRVGSLSEAAIFSFYGNKIITTGEGGILVTNNQTWAERAFFLENQGRYADNPYWHPEMAYNYRMTNIQAAIGLAQLERIDEMIAIRRRNAAHYQRRLAEAPGLTLPPHKAWAENVYWMYSVIVEDEFGLGRDEVQTRLRAAGIDTRPFFYPVHTLPMYHTGQSLPIAEELGRRGLNLPSGATLTV
ncbi:MAG: DegT/DnrJ/EryC1/StrS family aminotransferase, partial [Chloroflexota bacterium]